MTLADYIFCAFAPYLLIPKRDWISVWQQQERARFIRTARFWCVAFVVLYVAHYFLVDIPAKKEPIVLWRNYRFSVSAVYVIALVLTYLPFVRQSVLIKVPLLLATAYGVYMQGQSMIWRSQVPFYYVPLVAAFGAFSLRLPIIGTLLAYGLTLTGAWESFLCRPTETQHMVSAAILGSVVLVILRSGLNSEIENFILNQKHLESQKILIEAQISLSEQLRAFLPQELFRRVELRIKSHKETPLQAIDEILRPRKVPAAILFSDIRGFTSLTKAGDRAFLGAIRPAQKICTEIVDSLGGIPQVHGDLIFSYFDHSDGVANLDAAVQAGLRISDQTKKLNENRKVEAIEIRRYVIIAFGEATVGNIGGVDGAREITAMGTPANLPSRIDAITKDVAFQNAHLRNLPLVLDSAAGTILAKMYREIELEWVQINDLGIVIRDFPEETRICLMPLSDKNRGILDQSPDWEAGKTAVMACIELATANQENEIEQLGASAA